MKKTKAVMLLIISALYIFTASCSSAGHSGSDTTSTVSTEDRGTSSGSVIGSESTEPGITETESSAFTTEEEQTTASSADTSASEATSSGAQTESTTSTSAQTVKTERTSVKTETTKTTQAATEKKQTTSTEKKQTTSTEKKQTTSTVATEASTTSSSEPTKTSQTEATTTTATAAPPVIDPSKITYKLSFDNVTDISKNKNVFVFVIDRFDRVFAETAFMHDPSVFSQLTGFTYFEDHVSLYGHTYPSTAYLITGNKFGGESRKDYLANAYDNASPLKELKNNNYRVNVYTDSYYGYNTDRYVSKYVSNAVDNNSDKAKYSTKLDGLEEFYKEAEFKLTDDKNFSFIHLEGCHDCYFGGGTAPENLKEAQVEKAIKTLKRNFVIINKYIEKMKELGVYDNATIIITGDHGAAISDKKPLDGIRTTALFVKRSGKGSGAIERSAAQVCHDDLWATIFASEGIKTSKNYGVSVFEADKYTQRERTYIWHAFVKNEQEKTVYIEYRYTIIGSALDFGNWSLTKTTEYAKSLYS